MLWTERQAETAIIMWREGQTASTIGRSLGFSRNAVLGKLKREGALGMSQAERSRRIRRGMTNEARSRLSHALVGYWRDVHRGLRDRRAAS